MDTIVFGTPQGPTSSVTPYRSLVRTVAPVVDPVSLAEAKVQCRVDTNADDAYIAGLVRLATNMVENLLEISLVNQRWQASYDLFPIWAIILPRMPMAAGEITVTYRIGDGTTRTLSSANDDFQVDYNVMPGRIYPKWATSWPATRGDENSVIVSYPTGYGESGSSCPPEAKHLILVLTAHYYDTRQPTAPGSVATVPLMFDTLLAASGLGVYR